MSYVALYRSYRPSTFKEVIGQKHVVKTLKNAVMENKTSHAYIFSGLRGIGKTTIARILAKAVNCENPIDGEPCNQCKNCLAIINNETTDIIELDAASNNGVDEMRDILEKVNFLPSYLRQKVYIIDEAHMLSTAAFNALLKTLEEPPAYVMFILATTEPHKIPATILSRCQRFDFQQFTLDELKEEINYICEKEQIKIKPNAVSAIAEAADGGMRDALSILDQASVFASDTITVGDVNSVTGMLSSYKLIDLITNLKNRNATRSIEIVNELINSGKEVGRIVSGIIQFCRDILLYQNVNDATVHKYIYENEDFKKLASEIDGKELFYYIDVLVDVQNKIRFTNSQKIYLEVGIMKIINSASDDLNILNKVNKLEELVGGSAQLENNIYNQDVDGKINTLDNKIKKINADLEKAKLDEFKEKIEAKLELLEDVSSKNAALPTDLSFRLDDIEDKIRVISSTSTSSNTLDGETLNQIKTKLAELEEKIQTEAPMQDYNTQDYNALNAKIEALHQKLDAIEMNKTPVSNETDYSNTYEERLKNIEESLENLSQNASNTPMNIDDTLLKEIEELKENYFILVKNLNTNKVDASLSEELGFDVVDDMPKKDDNTDQMINELMANINRIASRLQENEEKMTSMNDEIITIKDLDKAQNESISKVEESIAQINQNNIYDEKLAKIDEKINLLETESTKAKEEITKVKQVIQGSRTIIPTPKAPVEAKPNNDVASKPEYQRPEIQRVVESNASKTLQTIKNVYDINVIENILHEARERECREEKARILSLWSKLDDKVGYAYAPIAKMLSDGTMVANGHKEVLITYKSASVCNHLMEPKNYNEAKQVLRIHLGKDYDFIALPENTWQEKRNEYIGQFSIGIKRPKLTPINNPELNVVSVNYNQINRAKSPSQIAKEAFGYNKVEKEIEQ